MRITTMIGLYYGLIIIISMELGITQLSCIHFLKPVQKSKTQIVYKCRCGMTEIETL